MSSTLEFYSDAPSLTPKAAASGKNGRTAQKLCAPCCYVVRQSPVRYCDAIAVAGDVYCVQHEQQMAERARQAKKFSFLFAAKAITSRGRVFA